MAELHQVLAVERDLEDQADKIVTETEHILKKGELFQGATKNLQMFDTRQHEANALTEDRAMTTTVIDRLQYTFGHLEKYLDCLMQKETTNQEATANICIGDTILMSKVPATMLLALERKFKKYRGMLDKIPTLQNGVEWKAAPDIGPNGYKIIELAPATKEHKAQMEKIPEDKPIGEWTTNFWCGMITSARKAQLINNTDRLIQEIKKARMRANSCEVVSNTKSTTVLFDWILGQR